MLENSPGHLAQLEPYFDFIISINDIRMVRKILLADNSDGILFWMPVYFV